MPLLSCVLFRIFATRRAASATPTCGARCTSSSATPLLFTATLDANASEIICSFLSFLNVLNSKELSIMPKVTLLPVCSLVHFIAQRAAYGYFSILKMELMKY